MSTKGRVNLKMWRVWGMAVCSVLMSAGCSHSTKSDQTIYAGKLVNYALVDEFTTKDVADVIRNDFSGTGIDVSKMIATSTAVRAYSVAYCTTDVDGALIVVSGLAAFPHPADGEYPVVQYHHGTQFNNRDVPSYPDRSPEAFGCMAVFAGHGYITSLPDYIGQGRSTTRHPYLHAASEASSSADMLKAVKELCGRLSVKTNSKLFILGHSQGGHATMALQRHLETGSAAKPFHLTASAPMAGPYDLPKAWDSWFADPPGCSPLAVHLILAYQNIYDFTDALSDIFLTPYDSRVLNIDDGSHDGSEMVQMLPTTLEGLLQPDFINQVKAKVHPFYAAMENNVINNFAPVSPTRLYHAKDDELVPYSCSVDSCKQMQALGAVDIEVVDVGSGYSHGGSFVPSVLRAKFWFDTF
ncbi:MAG: hypothetical protein R6X27_10475 [Candidatus Desulfacyla sp.]